MKKLSLLFGLLIGIFTASCSDNDDNQPKFTTENLKIEISGLKNINDNGVYEGWLITPEGPISTGKFSVNDDGEPSQEIFLVGTNTVNNATKFTLTIEPIEDKNIEPSTTKILTGDFSNKAAILSTAGNITSENDFSDITGEFILATPSTSDKSDESKGVWFLNNSVKPPTTSLKLPKLKAGWIYEGWVIIEEEAISTGKFSKLNEADYKNEYKGPEKLPPFPGEDFVKGVLKRIKKKSREKLKEGKELTRKDSIIIDFSKDKFAFSKVMVTLEPIAEKDDYENPSLYYKIFESDPLNSSTKTGTVLKMKDVLEDFPTGKVSIESK